MSGVWHAIGYDSDPEPQEEFFVLRQDANGVISGNDLVSQVICTTEQSVLACDHSALDVF